MRRLQRFCTSSTIWSRASFNICSAAAEFDQSNTKVWEVLACRNQFEISFHIGVLLLKYLEGSAADTCLRRARMVSSLYPECAGRT
jgi:hypothetical protein